jgi:hypothetical protein
LVESSEDADDKSGEEDPDEFASLAPFPPSLEAEAVL